ncbi:MAG: ATPase domain-containing protein [Candidatus Aenigmarchaeota archaeon]|nr:ATPase domain-containing protein [Candidatus Aenigmarchaeota archaeon]
MVERISSGIIGLDKLIENGFVKNSVNLITGSTGTGKTIFGLQFIWHGLLKGENGVFISLEQEPDEILADVEYFGWDFKKYIKKKKCIIEFLSTWELAELPLIINDRIKSIKAKRFVLDTLSLVCSECEPSRMRLEISEFLNGLRHTGATSLLTCEIPEDSKALSTFGVEEFLVDGIIVLNYLGLVVGGSPRSLIIRKMRRTKHGTDVYPIEITKRGIEIKKSI